MIDEALVSRTRQHATSPKAHRLRMSWWLHPRSAFLILGPPVLIGAYLVPSSTYTLLYGSAKYVDVNFVLVGLLIYASFIVGSLFAISTGTRSQENDVTLYCRWFVWPLFVLTTFGYAVWFGYSVLSAGGFGRITAALYSLLFLHEPSAAEYLKYEVFETIPGITTFTQFGILYATVEALLWVRGMSQRRYALARLAVIASATLLRTILYSERLALIEVIVPVAVIFLSHRKWLRTRRLLVSLAPLLGGLAVFALFAFAERFRSWTYLQVYYPGSYLQFAVERFFGYYTTAVNNAAIYYYYEPIQPLRWSLTSLLTFPGLGEIATAKYEAMFGDGYMSLEQVLVSYANPAFNNVAPIGLLLNDFSLLLAPVAAIFLGLVSSSLYGSFANERLVGLLLYPSWFTGLLEISRVYYWSNQRYFPTLAFMAISLLLFKYAKVPRKPQYSKEDARRE